MDGTVKVEGLESAMKALEAAFPKDPVKQRKLLNQGMAQAGRKTILPIAKQMARKGDSSGALSESLAMRARSQAKARRRGAVSSMTVAPVRSNRKAMAMYINHYLKTGEISLSDIARLMGSGIRHGHLVEWGTSNPYRAANPFMYPALKAGYGAFLRVLGSNIEKKVELAVKRAAKKASKK